MRQTLAHGLFGMLVIEPQGSKYMDPEVAGKPLESGWEAIIVDPSWVDFREFVIMMHEIGDEEFEILDVNDNALPVIDDLSYRPASRGLLRWLIGRRGGVAAPVGADQITRASSSNAAAIRRWHDRASIPSS